MSKEVKEGKIAAILSYFLIGVIWFFADEKMRKNSFVKFHVQQAMVLIGFSIGLSILMNVFSMVMFRMYFLVQLVNLALLVLAVMGILSALNGTKKELPVIGHLAEHIKL